MSDFYLILRELWLVWFMLLFSGIVLWAFWPARRRMLQDYANIPLRDDDVQAPKMR